MIKDNTAEGQPGHEMTSSSILLRTATERKTCYDIEQENQANHTGTDSCLQKKTLKIFKNAHKNMKTCTKLGSNKNEMLRSSAQVKDELCSIRYSITA